MDQVEVQYITTFAPSSGYVSVGVIQGKGFQLKRGVRFLFGEALLADSHLSRLTEIHPN